MGGRAEREGGRTAGIAKARLAGCWYGLYRRAGRVDLLPSNLGVRSGSVTVLFFQAPPAMANKRL
jgi:hypothetical protein